MKRSRGRGRRSGGGHNNNPNKHFESNGPGVKIRGSAQQILDKYQQYARDAQSSGDRVDAENYLQHAEHYYRVLAKMKPPEKPKPEPREGEAKDEQGAGAENGEAKSGDVKSGDGEGQKSDEPRENRRGRGRGRNRRDREDGNSEAAVEAEPVSGKSDAAEADKPATEDKPKRRRTYKKREPAAAKEASPEASDAGDDGVMKTLSRGRKKAAPKAEPAAGEVSEAPLSED